MNSAAGNFEWGVDSPLEFAAALLLFIVFVASALAAWRRLGGISRARWSGVAVLNALTCLAIFALVAPPVVLQPAADTLTLLTEGAEPPAGAVARTYVAPDAGDYGRGPAYLLDAGQLPLREPALGTLTVTGHGLDAAQWQHFPDNVSVRFTPPPLSGLVATTWARGLRQGEPLMVKGRYVRAPSVSATTIELLDPAGVAVATHDLLEGDAFALMTYPKAPGLLGYRLRVLDSERELEAEPVPVEVRPGERPVIYVLQSAPSFETRQLRNWAGDNAATLVIDTVITRGRELRQLVNTATLADDRLSPALLETTGLAVVDGRAWTGLDTNRRAWFEEAVRGGMGLLILADGDLAAYLDNDDALLLGFSLVAQERDPDGYVPAWESSRSEQHLPLAGLALEHQGGAALTRTSSGEAIEAYRNVGLGRVAISVLRERHRWLTSGDAATYTAYWASLMGQLGRPAALPYLLPMADDAWPRPQKRSRLCALAGDADVSFEIAPLHGATMLSLESAAPSIGGPRRCAEFWPQQAGWHRVGLYASETDDAQGEAYFYVFAEEQWQAHWRYERQQATLARSMAGLDGQAAMTRTARIDIDPLWPWLLFMFSAGLLWLERRLSD